MTVAHAGRWSPREAGLADGVAGWIDARWVMGGGAASLSVEDPALGLELGRITEAGERLVDEAAESAARSPWLGLAPRDRGRVLAAVASAIRQEEGPLAVMEAVDTGKPLSQARADVVTAAEYFEYFGALADKLYGCTIPQNGPAVAFTQHEPYGVVAHITPWNSPLSQMCRGVAPALAAGNTVVVKPSELTPYSSLWCAALFVRAGLPSGACNVVVGRGPVTGAALVRHPAVRHVSFTGSVPTGRKILELAAPGVVPCTLELGGKSPLIVCDDADVEAAADAGIRAIVRNAGQSCFAPTRMIADERVRDRLVDALSSRLAGLTMGHPLDDPEVGALSSAAHLSKVQGYIESAVAQGAEAIGGEAAHLEVEGCPGHFLRPTVLTGVTNEMTAAREEIFGPVQCVLSAQSAEVAVRLANDTAYGLTATVFSRDIGGALQLAQRLHAGQVHINRYPSAGVDVPFGGYKSSGIGREKGWEAMLTYTQTKAFVLGTK